MTVLPAAASSFCRRSVTRGMQPPQPVPALVHANAAARILVEPSIMDLISAGDLPSLGANAAALPPDHQVTVGDVLVTAVGGRHAIIHVVLCMGASVAPDTPLNV